MGSLPIIAGIVFGIVPAEREGKNDPSFEFVRRLTSEYPADDVQITVLDRHHLRCAFPPYNDLRPQTDVVTVWVN